MDTALRIILPLYFLVYFGVAFVIKTLLVARRTGTNPLVLPKDDSAYGLIGRYFKITLIALFVYVLLYSFLPGMHTYFLPITWLQNPIVQYAGLLLLVLALVWTVVAQSHMRNSWRIGIDTANKTELVTAGLFGLSRNPIFLGMIGSLVGVFLVTPNACTLLFLVVGYMLMQVQIRLEEEFLVREHGAEYMQYQKRVRRLI
ncbi:methyltransferase family protein [Pseudocnuella soli]|uniref:methyltransferase family protein n=1 Tax=Pseudocnuella soli TaxID=2502779 RepID=UPI00104527E5|nr:isoprenylcysteine carboxylmethyltransferase family protein [Pseudocnuella soli]